MTGAVGTGLGAEAQAKAAVECEVCTRVTQVIEGVLLRNATETDTFQKVSSALCVHLPTDLVPVCRKGTSMLDTGVFKCLIHELNFGSLCSDPGVALCRAARPSVADPSQCVGMGSNVQACAGCEFAVSGLQQYVNDTSTLIVKSSAEDLCGFHFKTSEAQQMCRAMTATYGDVMLRLLAHRLDAGDFCCGIGLCHTTTNKLGAGGLITPAGVQASA
jgi:hypothetical protein